MSLVDDVSRSNRPPGLTTEGPRRWECDSGTKSTRWGLVTDSYGLRGSIRVRPFFTLRRRSVEVELLKDDLTALEINLTRCQVLRRMWLEERKGIRKVSIVCP